MTALSPREERESRPRKENKRRSRIDHEKVARFKRRRERRGARSRAAEMRMGEGVFEVSSCVVGGLRESGEFGI